MAQFFDISAPPQSLEALDNWGSVDSLPASLDSELWNSAGICGLSIAEQGRASALFVASTISLLAGTGHATSSGALQSSVLKVGATSGVATVGGTLGGLRLRFSGGTASARAGGSLRGVGVLYMDMGGEARTSDGLHGLLTASVTAGGPGACSGSMGLNFVRLLGLPSGGRLAGGMELEAKGWNWLARAPLTQAWEEGKRTPTAWNRLDHAPLSPSWEQGGPSQSSPQALWHEPERERSSAWL